MNKQKCTHLFIYLPIQQPLKKRIISRCGKKKKNKTKINKNKTQNIHN